MKRTILLIFIALITAIGCQAQEADATKRRATTTGIRWTDTRLFMKLDIS